MSITRILSKALTTSINVTRRSGSITDIGEFSDSEAAVYSNLPALIQPRTSEEVYELQGIAHRQTHVGFLDRYNNGAILDLKVDDTVVDSSTNLKHKIIAVQQFQAANISYPSGHHIRLILENLGDPRFI